MLLILYTALTSYMFFFSICIAPVVSKTLDRKNSSKLLRKVFPRNFIFGLVLSFLALIASVIEGQTVSFFMSVVLITSFFLNLKLVMPKINKEADLNVNKKRFSSKFKKLHFLSVFLYLVNIVIATIAICIYL